MGLNMARFSTDKWTRTHVMDKLRNFRPSKAQLRVGATAVIVTLCLFLLTTFTTTPEQRSDLASKIGASIPDRVKEYIPHAEGPKKETHDDDDWEKKGSDYRVLTSIRNVRGYNNRINVQKTGHKIINPTILELPRGKSRHDFILIARTTHVEVELDGKTWKQSREMATFANLTLETKLERPVLKADEEWNTLLLNNLTDTKHHCANQPAMDIYIGPEDMKLFWSSTGEPIVIYTYHVDDPVQCQGQWIVDLRAIMPEFEEEIGPEAAELMGPIRFPQPQLLKRKPKEGDEENPRYQREKNWAIAQSPFSENVNDTLFMVEPGQLFKLNPGEEFLEPLTKGKETESRVEAPYPPWKKPEDTWYSKSKTCVHDVYSTDNDVHQSTPMLSITLCNRGTCTPTAANTVLIGLIHRRYDYPTWYDRRIAAYSSVPPYNMLSVSKRLDYLGEEDGYYSWTGSMVYYTRHKAFPPGNHGFLDDEIILSFGIQDKWAGWIDVKAQELVRDHYMCEGGELGYHMRAMGEDKESK